MHLDHVNLCSSDVPALTRILEAHLGYRTIESGTVPDVAWATNPGSHYAVLVGGDGSNVVITQIDAAPDGRSAYPPGFHFGLRQPTARAVTEKHAELTAAGLRPRPVSAGFETLGATWTAFTCPLGDGLEVEINHRTHSDLLDGPEA